MKSLMDLLCALFRDGSACCPAVETERDMLYISDRVEHEGLSFLTITLPTFCDDFDRALDEGFVAPTMFSSFKKHLRLPCFLRGFASQVFDKQTGVLLQDPSLECIAFIRQVTRLLKKVRVACTEKRTNAAFAKYMEVEREISQHEICGDRLDALNRVSWLASRVFATIERNIAQGDLYPHHGPGAVAEKLTPNQKYRLVTWHTRLDSVFPFDHYMGINPGLAEELGARANFHDPEHETPVRVTGVPKTLKAPRIIAVEPACMMFMQQALKDNFYRYIEEDRHLSGHVNFTNQEINRELARIGSVTGAYATLDLSDASDRVLLRTAAAVFAKYPLLWDAMLACRSTRADVPGFGVTEISKFASMGSALCFPVEALCFYFISICALLDNRALPLTSRNIVKCSQDVYVYGDDIIVPTGEAGPVITWLESFGLKVNVRKSFTGSNFRESCGGDFFRGEPVKPVYLRELLPSHRRDSKGIISGVAFANQLYEYGYWNACQHVRREVDRACGFGLPITCYDVFGLHYKSHWQVHAKRTRWSEEKSQLMARTLVIKPSRLVDPLFELDALRKFFVNGYSEDKNHLCSTVRRGCVKTKVRESPITK